MFDIALQSLRERQSLWQGIDGQSMSQGQLTNISDSKALIPLPYTIMGKRKERFYVMSDEQAVHVPSAILA